MRMHTFGLLRLNLLSARNGFLKMNVRRGMIMHVIKRRVFPP